MPKRYRGGFITANPPAPSSTSAQGSWNLAQQLMASAAGNWPVPMTPLWTDNSGTTYNNYNYVYDTAFDASGNVYVLAGGSNGYASLTKIGPDGTKLWAKSYYPTTQFASGTNPANMSLLSGGDVVFTLNLTGERRCLLLRVTGSTGALVFSKSFGNLGSYSFVISHANAVDANDNIYVTFGYQETSANGSAISPYFASVVKLNSSGAIQWQRKTANSSTNGYGDWGTGIAVGASGNVYVSGVNLSTSSYAFVKVYNSSGTIVASYRPSLSGATTTLGGGIAVDSSENMYISGQTNSAYYVAKLNSSGTPQWGYSISVANGNPAWPVKVTAAGVFAAMRYDANNTPLYAQFSTAGSLVWQRSLTGVTPSSSFANNGADAIAFGYLYSNGLSVNVLPSSGPFFGLLAAPNSGYAAYSPQTLGGSATATASSVTESATTTAFTVSDWTTTVADLSSTFAKTSYVQPISSYSNVYTVPGTYTWIAPTGVTSVAALAIGGGGGGGGGVPGNSGLPGSGGGLAYKNGISVTPGSSYTVVVGAGGAGGIANDYYGGGDGGASYFADMGTIFAGGGGGANRPPGSGGGIGVTYYSGGLGSNNRGYGGGGAAGYAGNGGNSGLAGLGGGGGGGTNRFPSGNYYPGGGSGGGTGIAGQGANGAAGGYPGSPAGSLNYGGGGGGGGSNLIICGCCIYWEQSGGSRGGSGAVRIVIGSGRSFPSTNVGAP